MKLPVVEFWFDFASTYSYPAAMRIEYAAAAHGAAVAWRAFLLGPIFESQGWRDSPFNLYPAKGNYMWRDVQRLCDGAGLEFQRPSHFPRNGLLPARVACAFDQAPWVGEFVRRIFTANFALDRDIGDPEIIADCLELLELEPQPILEAAQSPDTKTKLRERTGAAEALGIFGAPSFISKGELFWGNERLDQAIAYAIEDT